MKKRELDYLLRKYFATAAEVPKKAEGCPSVENLGRYVLGGLGPGERRDTESHVKDCKFCNELIEGALLYSSYGKHIDFGSVPDRIKSRAKSLYPAYKIKGYRPMAYLRNNIWLLLSLISLAASFFASRYFMQFLILAVILGLKWVFNKESTQVLIMVYNAWKRHNRQGDKEMEEIFRGRL